MVADEVVVETRRAGDREAWRWSSDGKGSFTIAPLALEEAPERGTRVILHLNDASKEFLDAWRVERIIREHSGAVAVPIDLVDKPGAEPKRRRRRRGDLGEAQIRGEAGGIHRVLPRPRPASSTSRR